MFAEASLFLLVLRSEQGNVIPVFPYYLLRTRKYLEVQGRYDSSMTTSVAKPKYNRIWVPKYSHIESPILPPLDYSSVTLNR